MTNEFVGLFGNLFEFSPEAQFAFTGVASGAGEQAVFSQLFTYGFTLTNITDVIGFAPVNSSGVTTPPIAVAQRSDFLPTLADQYVMETRFAGSFSQGIPTQISLSGGGSVQTRTATLRIRCQNPRRCSSLSPAHSACSPAASRRPAAADF